jgi:glycosyltransferase involved in cell wall biosynthesis
MMVKVVHVIFALDRGGAARTVVEMCRASRETGSVHHSIVTLSSANADLLAETRQAGIEVNARPDDISSELAGADIVQVEYFNHPLLLQFLASIRVETRLLVWCHVAGDAPPNVITVDLADFADLLVTTSEYSYRLPKLAQCANVRYVHGPASGERAKELLKLPVGGAGNTVGYIGTVDFVKMHRDYIRLHCAIDLPALRVVVCGAQAYPDGETIATLKAEAAAYGRSDVFEFRGYVKQVTDAFGEFDVYGYPLCPGNYASIELNLQEAMYAAVPPVVLRDGAAAAMVADGQTGYVVADERAYAAAVTRLLTAPPERYRLGLAARKHALATFGSLDAAHRMNALYDELMLKPKRSRRWSFGPFGEGVRYLGAASFLAALGEFAQPFRLALSADPDQRREGEHTIRSLSAHPTMGSSGFGSVRHYFKYFPDDPFLRYWTALSEASA